jgi:hypothetical protein
MKAFVELSAHFSWGWKVAAAAAAILAMLLAAMLLAAACSKVFKYFLSIDVKHSPKQLMIVILSLCCIALIERLR